VVNRNTFGKPLVENNTGTSFFPFALNTAWFPPPKGSGVADGLIVRVQENCTPECTPESHATHPEWADLGAVAAVTANLTAGTTEYIDNGLVFWGGATPPPHSSQPQWGAIDPRVAFRPATGEYFLAWDNCTYECRERVSVLSVSKDPFNHASWELVGPVIPGLQTAGVSMLFLDHEKEATPPGEEEEEPNKKKKNLAFVSSYDCSTILLAESAGGTDWAVTDPTWMQGREGCWDDCGAIAGAQPEKLSSGDYFMVYNIDTGIGRNETNYLGRCTIGWVVLDGRDPRQIVARSEAALVVPELPWEKTRCQGGREGSCQTPYVIFSTGMKPLGNDDFTVLYGAGDSDIGGITIHVNVGGVWDGGEGAGGRLEDHGVSH
jgi:predicted GH43/DUF377 family glycosyl hydrolase